MADQAINYEALAEQARKGTPPAGNNPPGAIDYNLLAGQARGDTLEPIRYSNGMPVYSIDVYGRPASAQPPVYQGTDTEGKPIIAPPPPPAAAPLAWGLRKEAEPIAANIDPKTGEYIKAAPMGSVPLLDAPFSGAVDAIGGFERVRDAKTARDVAGGTSEMIRGVLEAATPFLPGAFAGAPLATALTLASGTALSTASEHTLNALGVPKEYSALASDLIGLYGAGAAHEKLKTLGKVPYFREANEIQARLEDATARAKDPNATPTDRDAARAQIDALLQDVDRARAAGRPAISPEAGAAREVIGQGRKYGIRVSAGDVSQKPTLKNIEVSAEKVPGMGMEPFRAKQQVEAKAAATGVKSQYEDALIDAEPSSLTELQAAAEGGDQRARNVLEKMNQAGNDPDRVIQASIGLGDWTTRQTATDLYDHVQKLAEEHELGDVPLKDTGKAIGSSLKQLQPAKLPNKEVIGLLQKVKESISSKLDEEGNVVSSPNNSYGLIRQLHSDLGDRIREYYQGNNALIGEKGVGHLERVQNALEDDMRNYARNSNVPEIVDAGKAADEYYKSARVPYKNGMLAAAATSTEPDQIFQQFIKTGKGDRARNFYDALDDRGKAAVRYNMIAKAVEDSVNPQSGVFSPQKFFTAVDKLDDAYGVFFNGKDKAEIQGFKNLMGHVTRAGQYAENPPTGQRVIPYLIAGGAVSAAPAAVAHPFLAGAGLALIAAARGLFTTVKGRDLLLRLNGIKQGTPLMDSVWQRIAKEMPKSPPEEPPTGPAEGGTPPSAGSGGGATPADGGARAGGAKGSLQERLRTTVDEALDRLRKSGALRGTPAPREAMGPTQDGNPLLLAAARGQQARADFVSRVKAAGKPKGGSPGEPVNPNQAGSGSPSTPAIGPHGPIFHEYAGKPAEAIAKLQEAKTGEVPRVWHHPELGWIDLIWGDKSGGLAHMIAKHVEAQRDLKLEDLGELIPKMRVVKNDGRTARLESATHEAGVRLDYDGKTKRWLVTAYEKPPTGGSPLVPGSQ